MKNDSTSIAAKKTVWTGVKRTMKKTMYWTAGIMVVIIAFTIYWKYYFTYSEGYRAGLLQKFSHKGNVFKTYEGEMILSSIKSNVNVALASEKFNFSVTDEKLAQKLDTIQGQTVIVHYYQKNGVLIWRGESSYIVDSVKVTR